jgi:hypothetical protein
MAIENRFGPMGPPPNVEVSLVPPEIESEMTEDGGMLINLFPAAPPEPRHNDNLAEFMDERELQTLGAELVADCESDKESRSDWEKAYIEGLDLLGLKFEDRSTPWDGACGVFHPMLSEAVVRFQAQTIQEIFPASGPCKTKVAGKEDTERVLQANRVQGYMNYLATEEMTEYRNETERLLFSLPIAGSAFRKVYYDPSLGRFCSMFVPAEDFLVSYGTADLATCERASYVMKRSENWVRRMQVAGFYRDVELPKPAPDTREVAEKYQKLTGHEERADVDSRHTIYEMMVDYHVPGFEEDVALPYVITVDKSSGTVLSIYRNWRENDPNKTRRDHFVHYQYLPGLGFYGFGLVHMIGGLSKSATSLLRQLIDAGTLSNLPGGFKTRGLRIKGDDTPIAPGEYRDVDVPAGAIRDNIMALPVKEPSSVLYQLLADLVQEGRRFASAADVKAADINGEAPVGTTLAILEREMKVLSAVQARVHASMGRELRILAKLVAEYGPEKYPYDLEGQFTVKQDFDDRVDIIPVSDPNAGTMAQRIMQYQGALQLAQQAPQMYDMQHLHRQMLEALGIQDAEKVVPSTKEIKPADPVTENMAVLTGKPVKAFLHQDHESHIQVHMQAMQDPRALQMMEKNPKAKAIMAAMMDHITEHIAMAYRDRIEKELGTKLPPPDQPLPEDIEYRLSKLVAPAAAQVTGKAQKEAQAQKNAQMQKDPIIQMQMKEVQIKEKEQQRKEQESKAKAQLERDKLGQKSQQEQAELIGKLVLEYLDREQAAQDRQDQKEREVVQTAERGVQLGLQAADRIIEQAENEKNRELQRDISKEKPDGGEG